MHVRKEGLTFFIYATSIVNGKNTLSGIPSLHQDYKDVFQKKRMQICINDAFLQVLYFSYNFTLIWSNFNYLIIQ